MKIGMQNPVIKLILIFVAFTVGNSLLIFLLKLGMPIELLVFCVTFYIFRDIGGILLYKITHRDSIVNLLAFVISISWILYPSLFVVNTTAILFAIATIFWISEIKPTFLELSLFSIAYMSYDVFAVFVTRGMVELAGTLKASDTPLMMTTSPEVHQYIGMSMIGLGDIILPGLILVYCYNVGKKYSHHSLWLFPLIGYFVGLLIDITVMHFFKGQPQPATIYLCPGVFLGFWLALVWNHIPLTLLFKNEV